MEIIGFTSTFYTLWEATECNDGYTYYKYIQNLSKELEKAKAKHPMAIVDLTIRGHSSFRLPTIPEDCFIFGKYKNQNFNTCTDYSYMYWYYNTLTKNKGKKYLEKILCDKGYIKFHDNLITKKEYELIENISDETWGNVFNKVNNHQELIFKVDNPFTKTNDVNGRKYIVNTNPVLRLCFPNYREKKDCQGKKYYLPIVNGNEVSLLGQRIKVSDYEVTKVNDYRYYLVVNKFDFI